MILKDLKIPIIVGPTASGKTALSIFLAQELGYEIISADSRQLVKEMNVGTAKPTAIEMTQIKHHFIDIIDPTDDLYNSYQYGIHVRTKLEELTLEGKKALIVGGSGLYIQSVVQGFFEDLEISDLDKLNFRRDINLISAEECFARLLEIDPDYAAIVPAGNRQRVNRALEVFHFTGKKISEWQLSHKPELFFKPIYIGLTPKREMLYNRINSRVEIMFTNGLLAETKELAAKYGNDLKRLRKTIGYMEIMDFLDDRIDFNTVVEKIQTNTRHYAKRQLTWFKRVPEIKWFDLNQDDDILKYLKEQKS